MVLPLNTRRVWVAVSAALRVPLNVGVVSSVVAPRASRPVLAPTLSSTWVMVAVWLGAAGLTAILSVNERSTAPEAALMLPARLTPASVNVQTN